MAFEPYPLLMAPHFAARPWGGSGLHDKLGKPLPASGGPFGEAWELSDHPAGLSRVANGAAQGERFGDLMRRHPRELLRVDRAPDRFPLLIKFLDAAENLSVQVHPDDGQARELGERGKHESWFIIDCPPGGEIVRGMKPNMTQGILYEAALDGDLLGLLQREKIAPGDLLDIPPGTVHALLAGTMILEIQQASDATYRLWDWERKPAREMHLEAGCKATRPGTEPPPKRRASFADDAGWEVLASNAFYEVAAAGWTAGARAELMLANEHGAALNVVGGGAALEITGCAPVELEFGQTWFVPARLNRWTLHAGNAGIQLVMSRSLEL